MNEIAILQSDTHGLMVATLRVRLNGWARVESARAETTAVGNEAWGESAITHSCTFLRLSIGIGVYGGQPHVFRLCRYAQEGRQPRARRGGYHSEQYRALCPSAEAHESNGAGPSAIWTLGKTA